MGLVAALKPVEADDGVRILQQGGYQNGSTSLIIAIEYKVQTFIQLANLGRWVIMFHLGRTDQHAETGLCLFSQSLESSLNKDCITTAALLCLQRRGSCHPVRNT